MAQPKKFGTFSGVFSPSILTILGVIMYLRFPAIIGQAGLINTIGIIIIAHIISITTSLSVASLSTDKPVQNGGTYFMISRSLGLPIGGTLGLALFVGLSFSVSLYLIGFAESFLQYWNLDSSIQSIRITGSIVLLVVTTITFISTSLAIKSQYVIMAAIGLSLLSIFLGNHDFQPTTINLAPLAEAAPFMVLFGIFFPAVTGFEAGVSMSGDLKNPKKSLPVGAMMAVGVGFVVYIGLALFFAYTVDANALMNDPQILFKISLVPALVIAGIWGATLSSALGSILGAPRILQSIAMDKIAPKVFAKGSGASKEPRNALLLAFVIAEAGILIGELDVIARIVSMFFITTYAFLNLASAIESWSSSDFRPAFKVPRFVSILGTLSAFFVMILLDFLALAGATVVLGFLYFWLQRKELILESGDAWSSFWTNLAKRALLNLSYQKSNKRNWQPNIILFSGGEQARPHLVEMGLALTGKLGALTDFNLITDAGSHSITESPAHITSQHKSSFFKRQFKCTTIESGIQTITSVYGFSGFEPNTILMGWSKSAKNIDFLSRALEDFKMKKLNAVFLDYDHKAGFGRKEKIDIWWNGKGRHLSFALNILKFLQFDPSWRDATIRILIINNDNALSDRIYRNTNALLEEKRIKAQVKVISDDFGTRTKESIISDESAEADLVVVGLSPKPSAYTPKYIESISHISSLPSSLMILSPSNEFEEVNLVEALPASTQSEILPVTADALEAMPPIKNKVLSIRLEKLDEVYQQIMYSFMDKSLSPAVSNLSALIACSNDYIMQGFAGMQKEMADDETHERSKTLIRYHQSFLININHIINTKNQEIIDDTRAILASGIADVFARLGNQVFEAPANILIPYPHRQKDKDKNLEIHYQKLLFHYFEIVIKPDLKKQLSVFETVSIHLFNELRTNIFRVNDYYEKSMGTADVNQNTDIVIIQEIEAAFTALQKDLQDYLQHSHLSLQRTCRKVVIMITKNLASIQSVKKIHKKLSSRVHSKIHDYTQFSDNWVNALKLINNTLYLDTLILSNQKISRNIIQKNNKRIRMIITEGLIQSMDRIIANINAVKTASGAPITPGKFADNLQITAIVSEAHSKITEILEELPDEILLPETVFKDSETLPLERFIPQTISLKKLALYYLDTIFYESYYRETEQLVKTVHAAVVECKEAQSLLQFRLNNLASEANLDDSLFKKLITIAQTEKGKVDQAIRKMELTAMDALNSAYVKLFYHSIFESDQKIASHQREAQTHKISLSIQARLDKIKNRINKDIIYLLNSTSTSLTQSKRQKHRALDLKVQVGQLLSLVMSIIPNKKAYHFVPVFYRTLFSSQSKINDEFWVPRDKEYEQIKWALNRHKEGFGGAVLITGEHGSGRTTLSRYATSHLFKKENIIWINSPMAGSVEVNDLLWALNQSGSGFDSCEGVLDNLPFESVVVINDFELWWERSLDGYRVIEKIMELIHNYQHKVFFIINCNVYFFHLVQQILPLQDYFTTIIDCGALNAIQLQQMILNRHKSSGLSLWYKSKSEEALSQLDLAILFNAYFNVSKGNPGVAINMWKANIIKADSSNLTIQKPEVPTMDLLDNIDPDWLVIIALFIQHKIISLEKLSRIAGMPPEEALGLMNKLLNAGLVTQKETNTFALGRNIEPYLTKLCLDRGII